MLVGHYDEAFGLRQTLACNLAQQLAAEPAIAPIPVGAYQLEAPSLVVKKRPQLASAARLARSPTLPQPRRQIMP